MLSRHFPRAQFLLSRRILFRTVFVVSLLQPSFACSQNARGLQPEAPAPGDVAPGPYYALVIGIDNYPSLPRLTTAVHDAQAVGKLLESSYGFAGRVTYLFNQDATRARIMNALEGPTGYGQTLSATDNLLIYYAGHGYNDTRTDKAYWLPYDAESVFSANHISADDLTTAIRGIASHHVLVISDSCYSGDLTRGADDDLTSSRGEEAFVRRMLAAPSRNLLASGGNEPVSDAGPDGHSVFAAALLRVLADQPGPLFTAADLADPVKKMVRAHSGQIPEYFRIGNSMPRDFPIDLGDFVFARSASSGVVPPSAATAPAPESAAGPSPAPPALAPAPPAASSADDEFSRGEALFKAGKYSDAAPVLTSACNQDNLAGCVDLGWLYQTGNGVSKDLPMSATLYDKACTGGYARGCYNLGWLYMAGMGVPRNPGRGAVLIRKACDGGFAPACDALKQIDP